MQTKGICKYCGKEYTRGGMLRHLAACKTREAVLADEKTKTKCGWCDKCLRTLLTLEVIQNGNIDMYADKFELKKYYEHREDYIKKVFKERKSNFFYQEIVELILQRNYPIASSVKRHYEWELLKERFSSVIIKTTNRIAVMPMRILHKIKSKIQNK